MFNYRGGDPQVRPERCSCCTLYYGLRLQWIHQLYMVYILGIYWEWSFLIAMSDHQRATIVVAYRCYINSNSCWLPNVTQPWSPTTAVSNILSSRRRSFQRCSLGHDIAKTPPCPGAASYTKTFGVSLTSLVNSPS